MLFFKTCTSILAFSVFYILLFLYLQVLSFLSSFGLLNFICDSLRSLISFLTIEWCFIFFTLREILNFLLLSNYFVQCLNFLLITSWSTDISFDFFDFFDTFIDFLGFTNDILFLPVLGTLLADLELDFERVEFLN
mgnify:FL=1